MIEKLQVFRDGDNIWIKVPGEEHLPEILSRLLINKEENLPETKYLVPEEEDEVIIIPVNDFFPAEEYMEQEEKEESNDNPYRKVLDTEGPKALGMLYQKYAELSKQKCYSEMNEIKEGIRSYMIYVAQEGFDAVLYSKEEVIEILSSCKEKVFMSELPQIYEQVGVADFEGLMMQDEIVLKGALTACMNSLYAKM